MGEPLAVKRCGSLAFLVEFLRVNEAASGVTP